MIGLTTIVTSTYNKEEFLPQGAESVFNQTRRDWRWWIILDGANASTTNYVLSLQHRDPRVIVFYEHVGFQERKKIYRPSVIMNKYFPLIATDYFCWLSDDDIMQPTYIESMASALDQNPDWDVVFGWCDVINQVDENKWTFYTNLGRHENNKEYNKSNLPILLLDGGQLIQTKQSYMALNGWQFPFEGNNTRVSDGLYMNELAKQFIFHPLDTHVLTHRTTYISENTAAKFNKKE